MNDLFLGVEFDNQGQKDAAVAAICAMYKYPETVKQDGQDVPNPTSRAQFAANVVRTFVQREVARNAQIQAAKAVQESFSTVRASG